MSKINRRSANLIFLKLQNFVFVPFFNFEFPLAFCFSISWSTSMKIFEYMKNQNGKKTQNKILELKKNKLCIEFALFR